MFDSLLQSYYVTGWINAASKLPKEVIIATAVCGTAYFLINDMDKRRTQVKITEVEATAKVREIELEVEKLRLQIELHEKNRTGEQH